MRTVRGTGRFVYFSLGLKSTVSNVHDSYIRIRDQLGKGKQAVTSLTPAELKKGEAGDGLTNQFIKIKDIPIKEREQWKKIAQVEVVVWLSMLGLFFTYVYFYSLNVAVGLALSAAAVRLTLVIKQLKNLQTYK